MGSHKSSVSLADPQNGESEVKPVILSKLDINTGNKSKIIPERQMILVM